jgi:hypothetical protein
MIRFIFCAAALTGFAKCSCTKEKPKPVLTADTIIERPSAILKAAVLAMKTAIRLSKPFSLQTQVNGVLLPFLDARGHVFNNGKWAANAGAGLRALWKNRAYGYNTFTTTIEVRDASTRIKLGVGLETLGELFDFRINGYFTCRGKGQ